jgi:hypothetical protein
VILATMGQVWSLTLAKRATYPLAASRAEARPPCRWAASAHALRVAALFAMVFLVPETARATSAQGQIVVGKWKAMDKCAIEAQQAYPDFTADSNAKRDAKLKECLASRNLPPRGTPSER